MNRIPRSAAEHLRRLAPAGDHPDANLLSAFAEGALSAAERGRLTQHLAACTDCRESLALALPEPSEVLPGGQEVGAWWLRWPFLRWAGLAASMAVVAGVLVMQVARQRDDRFATTVEEPAPRAASQVAAGKSLETPSVKPESPVPARETASALENDAQKRARTAGGAIQPPRQEPLRALEMSAGAAPPASPAAKPAAPARTDESLPLADGRAQKKQDAAFMRDPIVPVERDDIRPATTQPYAFASQREEARNDGFFISESNLNSGDATRESKTEALAAEAKSKPAVRATDAISEMATVTEGQKADVAKSREGPATGRSALAAGIITVGARWRLVNGELQRSFDEGRNWEGVPIDSEVAPLAVDARAPVVWVAGDKRDLYHSSDNGLRWQRVPLPDALTGTVRELRARDRLRVDLTTSTGERWTTDDGGRTWTKK